MNDRPTPETDAEWDRLQMLPGGGYSSKPAGIKLAFGMAAKAAQLERERDEAREELASMIEGEIDGGDTDECFVMVRVNVPPTGLRIGQAVKVAFAKEVLP